MEEYYDSDSVRNITNDVNFLIQLSQQIIDYAEINNLDPRDTLALAGKALVEIAKMSLGK